MSDPVQSIRVADAIAQRFRALLAGGGTRTTSEVELAIGEAQQIYPEIWRHLDDARTALVARGDDVTAFDHLRRQELTELGVTNVDITQQVDYVALMVGRLRTQTVKTATFNIAGYQRAREAIKALMTLMPEVDWAALAREEDRQIRAAGSLETGKWLGLAKAAVVLAALIGVAVLVYNFVWDAESSGAGSAPPSARPERPAPAVDPLAVARAERIRALRGSANPCDPAERAELAKLLREESQLTAARKLETEACVPDRPACDDAREAIEARLAEQLDLMRDGQWSMQCEGIVYSTNGVLAPAFAIAIRARADGGAVVDKRGVTSVDGARDLVPFVAAPAGSTLAGIGDLDDAPGDELVFVGGKTLVASRVQPTGFIDAAGPVLRAGCAAEVSVEKDFHDGHTGERHELKIWVPEGQAKRCLAAGRHRFRIVGDQLVED